MKEKIFYATSYADRILSGEEVIVDYEAEYTVICPFSEEIYGATEPTCNCDEDQQRECRMDI